MMARSRLNTRIDRLQRNSKPQSDIEAARESAREHLRSQGGGMAFYPGIGFVSTEPPLSESEWIAKHGTGQPVPDLLETEGHA